MELAERLGKADEREKLMQKKIKEKQKAIEDLEQSLAVQTKRLEMLSTASLPATDLIAATINGPTRCTTLSGNKCHGLRTTRSPLLGVIDEEDGRENPVKCSSTAVAYDHLVSANHMPSTATSGVLSTSHYDARNMLTLSPTRSARVLLAKPRTSAAHSTHPPMASSSTFIACLFGFVMGVFLALALMSTSGHGGFAKECQEKALQIVHVARDQLYSAEFMGSGATCFLDAIDFPFRTKTKEQRSRWKGLWS